MSLFGADDIDIDLPPPPTLPSWLGSLCSQIDSYKDATLPQVFTPKDVTVGQQSSHKRPSITRTEGESGLNVSLLTQNEQGKRSCASVCPDNRGVVQMSHKLDRNSDLPRAVNQQRNVLAQSTQPWLSLQPVSQKQSYSITEGIVEPSQPWPSCDMKQPSPRYTQPCPSYALRQPSTKFSQQKSPELTQTWPSCDVQKPSPGLKITNSRLTRRILIPPDSLTRWNQQPDVEIKKPQPALVVTPLSQSQQPPLGTREWPNLPSAASEYHQKPDSMRQRFTTPYSQHQDPDVVSDSPVDLLSNSPTYSPLDGDAQEPSWVPRMNTQIPSQGEASPLSLHPGHHVSRNSKLLSKPAVKNSNSKESDADNRGFRVGGAVMRGTGKESATPQLKTLTNPYTPAVINFQGACGNGLKLHSVEEIPKPYCDIFQFPFFNAVQSMAFDQLLYSDTSVVVSAPTGSGKTVLFELAIVRQLLCAKSSPNDIKVVYIGPMKSLCGERVEDWQQRMEGLGLDCIELTGDSDLSDIANLRFAHIICTTPEKWDSVTRRWKDNRQLFQSISLVCIDEVHIVGDMHRGATVEAMITRMKMVHTLAAAGKAAAHPVRFVAASATLPNIEDIGEWLSSHSSQAAVFKLGEEYRPVKLQRVVLGYPCTEGVSEFRFDLSLTYKLEPIIENYSQGKPTLVFCSSRKSCQQTAETLAKRRWGHSSFVLPQFRQEIMTAAGRIQEKKLSDLLMNGVGIHHAGLEVQDRKLVEELFRAGKLAVLIATSTLSVGVNLPAHLVIVKATHMYNLGFVREYSDQQLLQMIGRAGRPQFDTSATAVIMTKTQLKAKYESLVNGTQVIESMLHKNLTEHVNVEVVLHTVTDMADAASWLSHTLLHVRATKNPRHYGLPAGLNTKEVELKLQDMCMTALKKLNNLSLVTVDPETAMTSPTDRGRLMARYCLEFQTVRQLMNIPPKSSLEELIGVVSSCSEFQEVQLRSSEKKTLNTLNINKATETIRYPIKGKIKNKQMKVNVLVQAGLGCLPIYDYSLSQDLQKIFRVGQRVTKFLMEMLWLGEDYTTMLHAVELCKAFKARMWPDSRHVARQLEGIGPQMSNALVQAGLNTFQLLESADPHRLEMVVNRHPPFGNRVHDAVTHLPRYELVIQQEKRHQALVAELVVSLSLLNAQDVGRMATCGLDHQLVFIMGDQDNTVVFKWKLWDKMLMSEPWQRKVHVKRALGGSLLYVGLISLDWVGLDIYTEYQPFYTTSVHPQRNFRAAQQNAAKTDSNTGPETVSAGTRPGGSLGQRAGQRNSKQKNKSSVGVNTGTGALKKDSKIQQQLNVMHYKLQQFQYTGPGPAQKLSHHTPAGNPSRNPALSSAAFASSENPGVSAFANHIPAGNPGQSSASFGDCASTGNPSVSVFASHTPAGNPGLQSSSSFADHVSSRSLALSSSAASSTTTAAAIVQPKLSEFFGSILQGASNQRNINSCPEDTSVKKLSTAAVRPHMSRPAAISAYSRLKDPATTTTVQPKAAYPASAAAAPPPASASSPWGDQHLSPEAEDCQADLWRDLVDDFWDESDFEFDEPPCKTPKKSDPITVTGQATSTEGSKENIQPDLSTCSDSSMHSAAPNPKQPTSLNSNLRSSNCLGPSGSTSGFNSWQNHNTVTASVNSYARSNAIPASTVDMNSYARSDANAINTVGMNNYTITNPDSGNLSHLLMSTAGENLTANKIWGSGVGKNYYSSAAACSRVVAVQSNVNSKPQAATNQEVLTSVPHTVCSALMLQSRQSSSQVDDQQQKAVSNLPQDVKASGLKLSSMSRPVYAVASRGPLLGQGTDKTAVYDSELKPQAETQHRGGPASKASAPSLSGFGWENLQLYQSSRESMVNEDTQEGSSDDEEERCWSDAAMSAPAPLSRTDDSGAKTPSTVAPSLRPVAVTSPIPTDMLPHGEELQNNRYCKQSITTSNLLQGIF